MRAVTLLRVDNDPAQVRVTWLCTEWYRLSVPWREVRIHSRLAFETTPDPLQTPDLRFGARAKSGPPWIQRPSLAGEGFHPSVCVSSYRVRVIKCTSL